MGKGGGGSTQSTVDYPAYMKYYHSLALLGAGTTSKSSFSLTDFNRRDPNNLYDALYNAAVGDSPYADWTAYDPGSLTADGSEGDELHRVQEALTDLRDELFTDVSTSDPTSGTAITPQEKWEDWRDEANNAAWIDDAMAAYEQKTLPQHYRALNSLAASFADINAVNSSAFILGRVLLESERLSDLNSKRLVLVEQATQELASLWKVMLDTKLRLSALQMDAS